MPVGDISVLDVVVDPCADANGVYNDTTALWSIFHVPTDVTRYLDDVPALYPPRYLSVSTIPVNQHSFVRTITGDV